MCNTKCISWASALHTCILTNLHAHQAHMLCMYTFNNCEGCSLVCSRLHLLQIALFLSPTCCRSWGMMWWAPSSSCFPQVSQIQGGMGPAWHSLSWRGEACCCPLGCSLWPPWLQVPCSMMSGEARTGMVTAATMAVSVVTYPHHTGYCCSWSVTTLPFSLPVVFICCDCHHCILFK